MEKVRQKETILTIAAGFLVLFLIIDSRWMLYLSLGILIIGVISDTLTFAVHTGWFWIAEKMGYVMSRIILGITFLFVLLPVGTAARFFRKDFMMLRKRKDSYYHTRDHVFSRDDLKDPW